MSKRKTHTPGGPPISPDPVPAAPVAAFGTTENRGGRPVNTFPAVESVSVGGVTVARHTLSVQAEQLASINGRVLKRLNHQLKATTGVPCAEFFEAYRYVQAVTLGLLKEQRERARVAPTIHANVPIEDLDAQFKHEVVNAFRTFTAEDWALADRVRAEQAAERHNGGH